MIFGLRTPKDFTIRTRILAIVDRSENLLALDALDALLTKKEFDFDCAKSEAQGLEFALKNEYAVILLEIQMPGLDGFEVLKNLKDLPKSATTPIVFITGKALTRTEEIRAYQMGIADIILKPVIEEILESKLRFFVKHFAGNHLKHELSHACHFIGGESEMAKLISKYDWGNHLLGSPKGWPLELKSSVSLMLNSGFPMFIAWGDEGTFFFNDAYRPILGAEKYPRALGAKFEAVWSEVWTDLLLPLVQRVRSGESCYFEDMPLLTNRNGRDEQTYFTFSYSPIKNSAGAVVGLFCACVETTARKIVTQALEKNREHFKLLFEVSPLPMWIFDVENFQFLDVNDAAVRHHGYSREEFLAMKETDIRLPEDIGHFENSKHNGYGFKQSSQSKIFRLLRKDGTIITVEPSMRDLVLNGRKAQMAAIVDVTARQTHDRGVLAERQKLQEAKSQLKFESHKLEMIFNESPAAMALWRGHDLVFEKVNPQYQAIFPDRELVGKPFLEACPEFVGMPFMGYLKNVFETGDPYIGKEEYAPLRPKKDGPLEDRYYDFSYHRIVDAEGKPYGVYVHAIDVTEKVKAKKALEDSASQIAQALKRAEINAENLKGFFKQAPLPMCIVTGAEHRFLIANQHYEDFVGQKVEGKTALEVFTNEQIAQFLPILDNVYQKGVPFIGKEMPMDFPQADGSVRHTWIDVTYQPYRDGCGKIQGLMALIQDVTEKVSARKMAEAREESLRLALEGGKLGAWSAQFPEGILTFDTRTRELHGILPDDKLNDTVSRQAHPDDQQKINDALDAVKKGAPIYDVEYRIKDLNGQYRWVHARGEAKRDKNGNLTTLTGVAADHTLQIEARKSIEESEFRARQIANSLPIIIWTADATGHVDWYNDWWYEYLGLPRGAEWNDRSTHPMHPEDIEKTNVLWYQIVAAEKPFVMEQRFRRGSDGQYRWHLSRGVPIYDETGKVTKYIGGNTDIHDEKMLAEELEVASKTAAKSEKNLQLALERGHLGIWQLDLETNIVSFSPEAMALFLIDSKEINVPELINSMMHPEDIEEINRVLHGAINERKPYAHQYRIITKDGQVRWLSAKGDVVLDDAGSPKCYSGTIQDITEQVIARTELHEARLNAERANETKTAFLANMSHEIRTPLAAILGFSSLLKEKNINFDERDQYIDTIVRNGNSLTRIIDDILDLAKVEAGKLDIETVPFSLYRLATEAVDLFKDKTKAKDIYLLLNIEDSVPSHICSDPTRLRQILVNLIGNAVKFTDKGGVRVSVRAAPSANNKFKIIIDVKDTGIGLTEEQKEKLFVPFTQADNSMTRKFGGTGLGLALSQRLSKALSGEILISEYKLGKGCTFTLTFIASLTKDKILNDSENKTALNTKSVSLGGLQVLVVDDSPDNLFLVERLLAKNGATVVTAQDGEEGVNKALEGFFDVILMDIQMPKLDGYQAKLALDKKGYKKPVIALTAHAMSDERMKTKSAGFAGHLTKPINGTELISTMALIRK